MFIFRDQYITGKTAFRLDDMRFTYVLLKTRNRSRASAFMFRLMGICAPPSTMSVLISVSNRSM